MAFHASGNAIIKPIPTFKPAPMMNPEMVDGMAQKGQSQSTDVPMSGTQPQPAQPQHFLVHY